MLDELRIRGLGVIDEATLPLGPGLTVVTGETGAGKTMVVTGLLLLFGGRADPARVRNGADLAEVDGRLRVPAAGPAAQRALDAGGRLDVVTDGVGTDSPAGGTGGTGGTEGADGTEVELVLRRTVSSAGRSRAYVGGVGAPVAVLGELAERLVAVHGQSDQLRLSRPGAQRGALDRFAGIDTSGYAAAYAAWRAATAELDDRTGRAAQLRREADLLAHGLREIDAVAPVPGEAEDLAQLAARLGAADALTHAARTAHDALLGESDDSGASGGDVAQLLASAARIVGQQRTADPEFGELAGRLDELALLAADLGADFGAYADALDADPGRLEQVESRRAALQALLRKYCDDLTPSTAGVLRWADDARARLAQLDVSDEALARLRAALGDAAAATAAQAQELSRRRKDAASALGAAVTGELAGLAMADARLDVQVARRPAGSGAAVLPIDGHEVGVGPDGADDVTFLLQPHPGAPPLPIARGASGGELSRVMLALEVCLGRTDPVPTMVFDEVDAGVGGRAAVEVGRRLARLARERQVLVVTHLPQVAAFADRHVVVDKPSHADAPDTQRDENGAGVTVSDIRVVSGEHRVAELARMLAGSDTPTARRHAAELLADAAAHRASDSS